MYMSNSPELFTLLQLSSANCNAVYIFSFKTVNSEEIVRNLSVSIPSPDTSI